MKPRKEGTHRLRDFINRLKTHCVEEGTTITLPEAPHEPRYAISPIAGQLKVANEAGLSPLPYPLKPPVNTTAAPLCIGLPLDAKVPGRNAPPTPTVESPDSITKSKETAGSVGTKRSEPKQTNKNKKAKKDSS